MSKIVSIAHTPEGIALRPADHYARVPLEVATLEAGRGIVTDHKGRRPERQLNVMAAETLEQLAAEGYRTAPGHMGEQIVISGIDLNRLAVGLRVQLGDQVIIEVEKPRTGCARLRHIHGCTPAQVAGRLGVMACVVIGGTIRIGDAVTPVGRNAVCSERDI